MRQSSLKILYAFIMANYAIMQLACIDYNLKENNIPIPFYQIADSIFYKLIDGDPKIDLDNLQSEYETAKRNYSSEGDTVFGFADNFIMYFFNFERKDYVNSNRNIEYVKKYLLDTSGKIDSYIELLDIRVKLKIDTKEKDSYLLKLYELDEFPIIYYSFLRVRMLFEYEKYNLALNVCNTIERSYSSSIWSLIVMIYEYQALSRSGKYKESNAIIDLFLNRMEKVIEGDEVDPETFDQWFSSYYYSLNFYYLSDFENALKFYRKARVSFFPVKKEMNPISNFIVDFSEKEMSIFDELESMLNKEQKQ